MLQTYVDDTSLEKASNPLAYSRHGCSLAVPGLCQMASNDFTYGILRYSLLFLPPSECELTRAIGMTLQDSLSSCQPFLRHAPNAKILAKQWLQMYQYGPLWVIPLVWPGTISNVYLAYTSPASSAARFYYTCAAAVFFSVLPFTFFHMEPGVNGAAKWKVQSLLRDDGFEMSVGSMFRPSAHRHASTLASRQWAERTEMKVIVETWVRTNNLRWMIAMVTGVLSGYASLCC
jgi:hypothetical protein